MSSDTTDFSSTRRLPCHVIKRVQQDINQNQTSSRLVDELRGKNRVTMAWDPDEWSEHVKIHAILMLLGWGYFIPVALFANSHLYRRNWREHSFGVHFHMFNISIGIVLALAGFGYGVKHFSTLGKTARPNVDTYNFAHAVIGTIATGGMLLEPLLMVIMRKPDPGQPFNTWPRWQQIGHFSHRLLGFVWFACAFTALEMGTHLTSVHVPGYEHLNDQDEKYSGAFLGVLFVTVLTVAGVVQFAIRLPPNGDTTEQEDELEKDRPRPEQPLTPQEV